MAGHTRNCITNPMNGKQPIEDGDWVVVHNGEIYNGMNDQTSDSYYILDAIKQHGPLKAPKHLDGIFAYVAYNVKTKEIYAARDPVGVIPMYSAECDGSVWISNELKALKDIDNVQNNSTWSYIQFVLYDMWIQFVYTIFAQLSCRPPTSEYISGKINNNLICNSIQKRLFIDVPWGMLLSGGVDSSIIASVIPQLDLKHTKWKTFHTFSIGLKDSPDLKKARMMADEIDSNHHEYIFTVEEEYKLYESYLCH